MEEMPAQHFLLLEMDVLQRTAAQSALPSLDHRAVFGVDIAAKGHCIFAGEAFGRVLVLANPIKAKNPARATGRERHHRVGEMLDWGTEQEEVGEQPEI